MAKPTIVQVIQSVVAAFVGVQSDDNRHKDFSQGSAWVYIAVGVTFTIGFIMTIVVIVNLVLG